MIPQEYVNLAVRTESSPTLAFQPLNDNKVIRLLHAGMGLCTEAGEFNDTLKRKIFYGKEIDEVNLKEELGDLMWYVAIACSAMNVDLEDVMKMNIAKLQARYPNKFTKEQAINRDLVKEKQILNKVFPNSSPIIPYDNGD